MTRIVHPVAGAVALATIVTFWTATVLSELFAAPATVTLVKSLIPWGFLILIPALAAVGLSGFRLSARRRGQLVEAKKNRMPIIAANGLLILVPSAVFLSFRAQAGAFDATFMAVQAIEFLAGAVNIMLLGLNMRDGIRIGRHRRVTAA